MAWMYRSPSTCWSSAIFFVLLPTLCWFGDKHQGTSLSLSLCRSFSRTFAPPDWFFPVCSAAVLWFSVAFLVFGGDLEDNPTNHWPLFLLACCMFQTLCLLRSLSPLSHGHAFYTTSIAQISIYSGKHYGEGHPPLSQWVGRSEKCHF